MPTLSKIIENTALRMHNVTVHIVSSMGTVAITDDDGIHEDIFLQGDDGSSFISEVNELYERTGDMTKDTIALCLAEQYVDCFWN